jgi:hypothetical protein
MRLDNSNDEEGTPRHDQCEDGAGRSQHDARLVLTGIQLDLHNALVGEDPACAEYYRAAIATLNDETLPDRIAITAHSLRELMEKLPNEGATDKAADLNTRLKKLEQTWVTAHEEQQGHEGERWIGSIGTALQAFLVEAEEFFKVGAQFSESRRTKTKQYLSRLEIAAQQMPPDMQTRNAKEWMLQRKYFTDLAHHRFPEQDAAFRQRVAQFESFLLVRIRPLPTKDFTEIDALLGEGVGVPAPGTVAKMLTVISRSTANYRYFFEKLHDAQWLRALAKEDVFKTPVPTVAVEGGVRFPTWPATQYLVRMAKIPPVQGAVAKLARDMQETDNISVHRDLFEIALALPPVEAGTVAKKATAWIKSPYKGYVHYHCAELIAHLARGAQKQAAFNLARATFTLSPQPESAAAPTTLRRTLEPQALLDDWHYNHALRETLPALEYLDRRTTIALVSELLDKAIEYSRRSTERENVDYSTIWHEAIEQDEEPAQLRSMLVSALRDTTRRAIEKNQEDLLPILNKLRKHQWSVFERLGLFLLAEFPEAGLSEIESIAPGLAQLETETRHEAAGLLKRAFTLLSGETQERILRAIDAGPDEHDVIDWLQFISTEPTAERIAEYGVAWRAERFSLLQDQLPEPWQDRAIELIRQAGNVRDLLQRRGMTSWAQPRSPTSLDKLRALDPDAVIALLRNWEPTPGRHEASREGLATELADVIAEKPGAYAAHAPMFAGLDPTYIRTLFTGLRGADNKKTNFDWPPVLDLADWVMTQPREISGRDNAPRGEDPEWSWTRGTIADLLAVGLQDGSIRFSPAQRARVWAILAVLSSDSDPTPEHEAKYRSSNIGPSLMSLNTVRGKAFHALIQFGLWVRRSHDEQEQATREAAPVDTRDVVAVLDDHLDLARDPALTIRSVYGQYYPWLQRIDREWSERATMKIFPDNPVNAAHWRAAWDSYLWHCAPYDEMLTRLLCQYQRAVREIAAYEEESKALGNTGHRLADHLMHFYLKGKIGIDTDDQLISSFFNEANDDVRSHALAQIGRWLQNARPSPTMATVLERLRRLWEWRLEVISQAKNPGQFQQEVASFGWWFSCGKFDQTWSMEQLLAALHLTGRTDPDFEVAERLADIAAAFPSQSVQIIEKIAKGDQEGWTLFGNRDHFTSILRTAIASAQPDAMKRANDLVNYLIAKGLFEYQDVMTPLGYREGRGS